MASNKHDYYMQIYPLNHPISEALEADGTLSFDHINSQGIAGRASRVFVFSKKTYVDGTETEYPVLAWNTAHFDKWSPIGTSFSMFTMDYNRYGTAECENVYNILRTASTSAGTGVRFIRVQGQSDSDLLSYISGDARQYVAVPNGMVLATITYSLDPTGTNGTMSWYLRMAAAGKAYKLERTGALFPNNKNVPKTTFYTDPTTFKEPPAAHPYARPATALVAFTHKIPNAVSGMATLPPLSTIATQRTQWYRYGIYAYEETINGDIHSHLRINVPIAGPTPKAVSFHYTWVEPLPGPNEEPSSIVLMLRDANIFHRFYHQTIRLDATEITSLGSASSTDPRPNSTQSAQMKYLIARNIHAVNWWADNGLFIVVATEPHGYGIESTQKPICGIYGSSFNVQMGYTFLDDGGRPGQLVDYHGSVTYKESLIADIGGFSSANTLMSAAPGAFYETTYDDFRFIGCGTKAPLPRAITSLPVTNSGTEVAAYPRWGKYASSATYEDLYVPCSQLGTFTEAEPYYRLRGMGQALAANNGALQWVKDELKYVEIKTWADLDFRLNLPGTMLIKLYDSNGSDHLNTTNELTAVCKIYRAEPTHILNVNKVLYHTLTLGTGWSSDKPYDVLVGIDFTNRLVGCPLMGTTAPHKYRTASDQITDTSDERYIYVPPFSTTWTKMESTTSTIMSDGVTPIGRNNSNNPITYLLAPNQILSANRELTHDRYVKFKYWTSTTKDELLLFKLHRNASGCADIPSLVMTVAGSGNPVSAELDPWPTRDSHRWLQLQTYGVTIAVYVKKVGTTYQVQIAWYDSATLGSTYAKDPRNHPDFSNPPTLHYIRKTITVSGMDAYGWIGFYMQPGGTSDYTNQNHEMAITPIGKRLIDPATSVVQPVCSNDTSTTTQGNNVTKDVLANDTNAFKVTQVTSNLPTEQATIVGNTTLSYTPSASFTGNILFTYTATNSTYDATCTGTWEVTVTAGTPTAVAECNSDIGVATSGVGKSFYVLTNDNNVASITGISSPPANGTASYSAAGTIYYTSNSGYVGSDTITYTGSNADGTSTCTGTLTIDVTANIVAIDDTYSTNVNSPVICDVMNNDNGGTSVEAFNAPLYGTCVYNGTTVTYTPDNNHIGSDIFSYKLMDGATVADYGNVTVTTINNIPDPVAQDDWGTMNVNTTGTSNVLTNDSNYVGDPTVYTPPLHGTAVNNGQTITYTPNTDYIGTDSFVYKIVNSVGRSATATMNWTIKQTDFTVSADDDTASTTTNNSVNIYYHGNDDADADIQSVTQPANGTATIYLSSVPYIKYTPDTDWYGVDTFTYTVEDDWGNTATATVTVTVEDNTITLAPDTATVEENSQVTIDVVANDDALTTIDAITAIPSNGTATIVNNKILYVPTPDYFGTDSLQYRGIDAAGNTALANVTITVNEVGDPIGPGLYKINSSPGVVMRRKQAVNNWLTIGTGAEDNELEIYLPATIAWNDTIIEGTTRCVINGITASQTWIAPGTMRELDFVYIQYTPDTSPPVSMSSNRHGLVLVFTDGRLTGGHYWTNTGNGPSAHPLYIPTYAGASGTESGTGRLTLPKQTISNWGKDYTPWNNTGPSRCSRGRLRHNQNTTYVPPSVPEEDIWIVDYNNSAYSAIWVSLSRYFENADPVKKSLVSFNFTAAANSLSTSSKTEVLWFDRLISVADDFPQYDLDKWLIIERMSETQVRLWIYTNGAWVSSGISRDALWVNNPYTTTTLPAMPRCPSHLWDDTTAWAISHINTAPPSVVDPETSPVIFVRHRTQYEKSIYIPRAFSVHDITDRAYTRHDFTITAGTSIAPVEPWSMISRAIAINFSPNRDDNDIAQPPQKAVALYFNNSISGYSWDFSSKYTSSIPSSGNIKYNLKQWSLDTSVQLSGDLELATHGVQSNYAYADWINQSIPTEYATYPQAPTGGVIAARDKVYAWTNDGYLYIMLGTCHTFGKDDRHTDFFRFNVPTNIVDAYRNSDDICVWDDLDTFAELIDALPEYIDDTIVIARRHLLDIKLYHVEPRVGPNPPVINSYVGTWCGYGFNANLPNSSNFGWDRPDCGVYNLDNLYFGGKRIVTTVPTLSAFTDTNRIVFEYTKGGSLTITLARMWLTAHVPDVASVKLNFELGDRWDPLLTNVTKIIIDARGDLDVTTNSDLYKTPMLFDTGDIEIVLARDAATTNISYTLHMVERIGDGTAIANSFEATSIVANTFNTFDKIETIPADNFIYTRTDADFGGLITENRVVGDTINWIDTTYFQKVPVSNPDKLRIDFVTTILTTLDDFAKRRVYIEIPLADIGSELDDMLIRPYTCFTNAYKPDVITQELPPNAVHGSTVISKLTIWSVRLHTFVTDTWYHIGDFRVYVDDSVPLDSVLFSKPACHLFITEQECKMGFTPADRTTYNPLPGSWTTMGEVTVNANEYLISNRLGSLEDNPPIMDNIYREFSLPITMLADTIELTFKRKPVGSVGYITSARIDSANTFFVFLTNASASEIDFSDMVPTVPAGKEIYTILLPLRNVPSPIFHDTDGTILEMELVQQLPTMTFRTTDLNTVVDGTHDVRLVAVKSGSRCGFWLYESGQLIARTQNSVDIPWIDSGTIGIHEHSLVPGIINDRVIDLELGYNRSQFGCLINGSIEPNMGCEPAPSTSEQSIHTLIVDNNVPYKVYTPLPGTIYGYVHIDIVNIGEYPARINLYKGKVDETEMILFKSLKPMTKDELVEIHNIRVLPGYALYVESLSGSIKVRCSSIEDKY